MTPALSTSNAAPLEATEDPQHYIERFLHIRDMVDQVLLFALNPDQGKPEGRDACYDDTVIAWAIAIQVWQRGCRKIAVVPRGYTGNEVLRSCGRSEFSS